MMQNAYVLKDVLSGLGGPIFFAASDEVAQRLVAQYVSSDRDGIVAFSPKDFSLVRLFSYLDSDCSISDVESVPICRVSHILDNWSDE